MENVYVMETYSEKGSRTINYGIQIGKYGEVVTCDNQDKLIEIVKKLSKQYNIIIDEPEEIDTEKEDFAEPTYRKITSENLLKILKDEGIIS